MILQTKSYYIITKFDNLVKPLTSPEKAKKAKNGR